jgi:hypothetical protein
VVLLAQVVAAKVKTIRVHLPQELLALEVAVAVVITLVFLLEARLAEVVSLLYDT